MNLDTMLVYLLAGIGLGTLVGEIQNRILRKKQSKSLARDLKKFLKEMAEIQ